MASVPHAYVSPEQYLARERQAERKSEYYDGSILSMAGASIPHNILVANIIVTVGYQLRGSGCRVFPSDLKVRVGTTRYFYPDISVICGAPQFHDEVKDVVLNPRVLIEVLSESTTAFDRGAKFLSYQQIPSLQDYLLVSQDAALVERFQRQEQGAWLYSKTEGLTASLELASIEARLPLAEVYDGVEGL